MPRPDAPALLGPLAAAAALALVLEGACRADVVYLFDETEIHGRIVHEDAREIILEVEGGKVAVKRSRIERIERREWTPARRPAAGHAPGEVLAAGLERRGTESTPSLARAAGAAGGMRGAALLLALLDELEARERALLESSDVDAGARHDALRRLAALRAAAFDGLAAGACPAAIPRLEARFHAACARGPGAEAEAERAAARDALCFALRRAGDEEGAPLAAGVLARASPSALIDLLSGLEGTRWRAIRDAAATACAPSPGTSGTPRRRGSACSPPRRTRPGMMCRG